MCFLSFLSFPLQVFPCSRLQYPPSLSPWLLKNWRLAQGLAPLAVRGGISLLCSDSMGHFGLSMCSPNLPNTFWAGQVTNHLGSPCGYLEISGIQVSLIFSLFLTFKSLCWVVIPALQHQQSWVTITRGWKWLRHSPFSQHCAHWSWTEQIRPLRNFLFLSRTAWLGIVWPLSLKPLCVGSKENCNKFLAWRLLDSASARDCFLSIYFPCLL